MQIQYNAQRSPFNNDCILMYYYVKRAGSNCILIFNTIIYQVFSDPARELGLSF
jgi:hypothetical protein